MILKWTLYVVQIFSWYALQAHPNWRPCCWDLLLPSRLRKSCTPLMNSKRKSNKILSKVVFSSIIFFITLNIYITNFPSVYFTIYFCVFFSNSSNSLLYAHVLTCKRVLWTSLNSNFNFTRYFLISPFHTIL